MGKIKSRAPREWQQTYEIDKCQRQTPTWFSSPKCEHRSLAIGVSHDAPGRSGLNNNTKRFRKARITLAKVWDHE